MLFGKKLRHKTIMKKFLNKFIIFFLAFFALSSLALNAKDNDQDPAYLKANGYTINYQDISIIEYMHFVSKVCDINFVYNDADLGFSISIISDGPILANDIMSTLIQELRIHGLNVTQQGSSLVVERASTLHQIASVTDADDILSMPLTTHIFRIQEAKLSTITKILTPFISPNALMETSAETNQIIITDTTANIKKIQMLLNKIDTHHSSMEIKAYIAKNNNLPYLATLTEKMMLPFIGSSSFSMIPHPLTDTIYIISTPKLIAKAESILTSIDIPPKQGAKIAGEGFIIYKPQNKTSEQLKESISQFAKHLRENGYPEAGLVESLESAKVIKDSNSIMFNGSKQTLAEVKSILSSIDEKSKDAQLKETFFIYKIKNVPYEYLIESLKHMASNLDGSDISEDNLIKSINSAKFIKNTNSLLFMGNQKTLSRLEELLPNFDVDLADSKTRYSDKFLIYKPQNISAKEFIESLRATANNLEKANLAAPNFTKAIDSMKYVEKTNSVLFTGDKESLDRIQQLIKSIDSTHISSKSNFFIYHIKTASKEQIEKYLNNIKSNLGDTNPDLASAVDSMKWVPDSYSFTFTGTNQSLDQIKELLANFDSPEEQKKISTSSTYFLYKLQNVSGEIVEEDIDHFISNIKDNNVENKELLDTLDNIKWIKETNSILITGAPRSIEKAKEIIAKFDISRKGENQREPAGNFFMYKPKNLTSSQIEKNLKDVAENLKKANLADPNFMSTIKSMKYVSSTKSLVFTGNQQSLTKIQELLSTIDIPTSQQAAIQKIGKTTILVYKIRNSNPQKLISSIKSIVTDLKSADSDDQLLINTLNSVRYSQDTNSLVFTGPTQALERIQPLVEQFDVPGALADGSGPSSFFIYKPEYQKGPDLEKILMNFANHLQTKGFSNPNLYNSIHSMKWEDGTKSLIFTGDDKSITEIKSLLKTFDIPEKGELPAKSIQEIDDTSFLVYKLQYHKGDEIREALKQIAKDLIQTKTKVKNSLLEAINTIQWIQVTNSLLCSGEAQTMSRLKELIKSLDIPLKQVFIEMLVIETEIAHLLDFGLDWGSKFKIKDRFAGSVNNLQSVTKSPAATTFAQNLAQVSGSKGPQGTDIPFTSGFGLGVIGDIILHKGKTFASLGTLVTALQNDSQATVIMTPKIIAQDSKTSTIFIGRNIPFVGSQVVNTISTTGHMTTTSLEYRDIGLDLTLTPVLGNTDTVTLAINLNKSSELTDATGQKSSTSGTAVQGITTSKTAMNTTVHIPNKHFLILSGMVNETKRRNKSGLPCLGSIPFLGMAFSETDLSSEKNNIVIFIRPHIINSYKDMINVSDNQESFFRENTGSPTLEKDFDESTDLIKSLEDE
jgi:type III secretion protein C